MSNEILENHRRYLERKKLYIRFGYDIDKERDFILEQARPFCGKILEVGTGKGHFAMALAKQGYSFVALDMSQEELQLAKLNLAHFGFEQYADFRIGDAEHTSFADGSFDTIFSVNTLHHLHNPYKVIDELTRILTRKGRLVLSDFTEEGFAVVDKIHVMEGKTHQVSQTTLFDIESYLAGKSFSIKTTKSVHQRVLVAGKGLIKVL